MDDKPRSKFADYVSPNVYDDVRPMTPEDVALRRAAFKRMLAKRFPPPEDRCLGPQIQSLDDVPSLSEVVVKHFKI